MYDYLRRNMTIFGPKYDHICSYMIIYDFIWEHKLAYMIKCWVICDYIVLGVQKSSTHFWQIFCC